MKLSAQEKIYKACGHEKRLNIIYLLKINKYLTVGQIAQALNITIQTTSKHLQVLERAHVLDREKEGYEVFYSLNKPLSPIVRSIISFL